MQPKKSLSRHVIPVYFFHLNNLFFELYLCIGDTYGSPNAPAIGSGDSYGAPAAPAIGSAPSGDSYGAPAAPAISGSSGDSYGSPVAPPIAAPPSIPQYGAPTNNCEVIRSLTNLGADCTQGSVQDFLILLQKSCNTIVIVVNNAF